MVLGYCKILNEKWAINLRGVDCRKKQLENMKKPNPKKLDERPVNLWKEFMREFRICCKLENKKEMDEFDTNDYKLMCKRAQHDLDRCHQNREYYIYQITHYGAVLAEVDKEINHYKRIVEVCTDQLEDLKNLENSDD